LADPTEDTVNDLLASYLRSKGINILTQFSARTPHGKGKPDFELKDGVILYGEGEWMKTYLTGYDQAIGFGDIPGASGYFLIGYPDSLRSKIRKASIKSSDPAKLLGQASYRGMLKTRSRPVVLFHGQLQDIPSWLGKGLIGEEIPQDPTEFVRLMNDIVIRLTDYLPSTQTFDSSQLFEHILATIPKGKGEIEAARRAAAYLLLNQIVFYRILQTYRFRPGTTKPAYDKIDPLKLSKPGDLKLVYFNTVLHDDYQAIFDFDVASIFPQKSLEYIRDLLRMIEHIEPEQFTRELLGSIFHRLIPIEVRKPVAAYYTNPMAARLLARLVVTKSTDTVSDLACGSGTLLIAAYDRKADLFGPTFSEKEHKRFIEEDLTGIDIMPFAAHLAVVQLALRNPGYWTDMVKIGVFDSTLLRPGSVISALEKIMPRGQTTLKHFESEQEATKALVREGAVSPAGKGKGFTVRPVDVVIMNPPFTRKQHVTPEFRNILTGRFDDYRKYASKEMNYFGYFILLADRFLKEGGRMAMVLPASLLREESLLGIRKLISERYTIKFIVLSGWRSAFSEDTSFREILLIAEKGKHRQTDCVAAKLKVMPSEHNIDTLEQILLSTTGESKSIDQSHDYLEISKVPQKAFSSVEDWRSLVPGEEEAFEVPPSDILSELKEVVPDTIQGIRFHSSSFKTNVKNTLVSRKRSARTRVEWAIVKETDRDILVQGQKNAVSTTIPKNVLLPATRSISGISCIEPVQPYDYVVAGRFKKDEDFWDDPRPDSILRLRLPHLHSRETYLVVAGYGNVDLTASGTCLLAFVSQVPIIPTWSMWSFKTDSYERAKLLALWWNSTYSLAQLFDERTEVRGSTVKWRKGTLETTLVIDEEKIEKKQKEALLRTYDETKHTEFPSIMTQLRTEFAPRTKIDMAVAEAADWPKFKTIKGLRSLYSELLTKLEELKRMMERD
jgi:hypothetical protein